MGLKKLQKDLQEVVLDGYQAGKTTCVGCIDTTMLPKYEKREKLGGKIHIPTPEERKTFLVGQKAVADWYVNKYRAEYYDLRKGAVARAEAATSAPDKSVME